MKRLLVLAITAIATLAVAQERGISPRGVSPQGVRIQPVSDRDLTARIWTDRNEYRVGENIRINYQASRDAYVIIFSTDAEGETRQLLPNAYDSDNFVRGGRSYSIPSRGYQLEVTPPKGRETLTIVAFRERGRGMDNYRASQSNPFPKQSGGAKVAIQRIEPRPDSEGRRYARDTTTVRVLGRNEGPGSGHRDTRLTIDSNPGGAYVYVNNQYRGVTPVDIRDARPGNYDITINRDGYYPVRRRVRVDAGERERITENLRPVYW